MLFRSLGRQRGAAVGNPSLAGEARPSPSFASPDHCGRLHATNRCSCSAVHSRPDTRGGAVRACRRWHDRPDGGQPARLRPGDESRVCRDALRGRRRPRTRDGCRLAGRPEVPDGTARHHQIGRTERHPLAERGRQHALPAVAGSAVVRQARPAAGDRRTRGRRRHRQGLGKLVRHHGADQGGTRPTPLPLPQRTADARASRPQPAAGAGGAGRRATPADWLRSRTSSARRSSRPTGVANCCNWKTTAASSTPA